VLVVVCISRLCDDVCVQRREVIGLARIDCVSVRGAAVAVQVVRLVEFPDLVSQGVLDRVAALLA
jgi:hypothetical protein